MGRAPSIDEQAGKELLSAYHRLGSIAAAARETGVSESAARRYFDGLPKAATPTMAAQRQILQTAGASLWNTRQALDDNYQRLLTLVGQLERGILEEKQGTDGSYTTMTPIATHVAALREVREHVQAGIKLFQLLLSIDETRKFQEAVLEAIGDVDDATRQRIIANLQKRRALEFAL